MGIIIGVIVGLSTVITLLVIFAVLRYFKKRSHASFEKQDVEMSFSQKSSTRKSRNNLKGSPSLVVVDPKDFDPKYLIPRNEIQIDTRKILGVGDYGIFYECFVREKSVAVKIPKNDRGSNDNLEIMLSELKILQYLREPGHANLVEFIGVCVNDIGNGVLYTVTGLCENGTLLSYIRRQRMMQGGQIRSHEMLKFAFEIASGMSYISEKKVVHRNLSAMNVHLDSNWSCKIGGFSQSRKLVEEHCDCALGSKEVDMKWRWLALESLKRNEFSVQTDVWSYGVTLWEIFSLGGIPYSTTSWSGSFADYLENGLRLEKPYYATLEIYSLMQECWKDKPVQRPNFFELAEFFLSLREGDYAEL